MREFSAYGLLLKQLVASLLGKGLKVSHRTGIGGQHLEQLAALHVSQGFLGLEDGQRAVQTARVNLFVDLHEGFQR